jgi:hypothetical protein
MMLPVSGLRFSLWRKMVSWEVWSLRADFKVLAWEFWVEARKKEVFYWWL